LKEKIERRKNSIYSRS